MQMQKLLATLSPCRLSVNKTIKGFSIPIRLSLTFEAQIKIFYMNPQISVHQMKVHATKTLMLCIDEWKFHGFVTTGEVFDDFFIFE